MTAMLGWGLGGVLAGQEPARLDVPQGQAAAAAKATSNQQIANTIAGHLLQSAHLQGLRIDVAFQNGTAELTGVLPSQMQRDEAVRIAQGIPGVERVRDGLTVAAAPMSSVPVQAMPATAMVPMPAMPLGMALQPVAAMQPVMPVQAGMGEAAPLPRPMGPANGAVTPFSVPADPAAVFPTGYQSPYVLNSPMMPPYAWPTYAPYNNYSRVAYPNAYPYNSWPFIGPAYPFPKVPLGWRKVTLEWQDGHWWFGKIATCYDWWRLRYW
jgi:hypothetical protein